MVHANMNKKSSVMSPDDTSLNQIHRAPYAKRIILALRKIMQQMDYHSHALIKHYDITVPQIICLYEIFDKGAVTLSVLSKNIHLSTSTLVGIIDRLEEKALVKRSRSLEDRRIIFIDITEKGKEFVRTSPQLLHNSLAEHLAELPESEQIIIANSLDLLVTLLKSSIK
jgi:DNA-binding MarR family transcriptional regulator